MKQIPLLHTRREFLRTTTLATALSGTVPGFLARTFAALQADAEIKGPRAADGREGPILVVLQMAGGNDGLNTVVPYANDYYRRARPRLAVPDSKVLRLTDDIALHPSLTGFKALYDAGQLAVVQGVGYPNPNRSHFRSTEIWQTASDSNRFEKHGWIGRFFDNACAGADPTVGISIGHQMPQAFAASYPTGISLENPQNYRFVLPHAAQREQSSLLETSFRRLNEIDDETTEAAGGTTASLHGPGPRSGSPLDFLERTALNAQVSSDEIRAITARVDTHADYPGSRLGNSLKFVARLIAGGLPARIYYLSQGGYDTHTNQGPAQERLLKDLGDAVNAFVRDLASQRNLERVMLMTFSEFGRRVAENANGGTDHGAAAPLFLVGPKLQAGLLGRYPSLAPADLFQGDLKYSVDFRSVYASLLEQWLRVQSQPILGRQFPPLPLV